MRRTDDGVPDRFDWVCSGTMVDRDTYLTAAHCTDGWPAGTRFFVSLEQDFQSLLDSTTGTPEQQAAALLAAGKIVEGDTHQDPAFPGSASDAHDIGVVDFAGRAKTPADVWSFTPATLPTAGQLTALGGRALDALDWTVIGYGTQEAVRGPGGQTHPGGGVRMKAPLDFDALNKTWVRLAQTAPQGNGGACYGDSGGPNFVSIGGKLVLAATTITGDVPCYATNVAYRMDTTTARTFLAAYVDLP
jgi:Trypsin